MLHFFSKRNKNVFFQSNFKLACKAEHVQNVGFITLWLILTEMARLMIYKIGSIKNEPRHEKTGFLPIGKQRLRSASQ